MINSKYVYPKLSNKDLYLFRLGGDGLGNILSTYINAYVRAEGNNKKLIWPTWPSLKVGPWIRHEKDKRFYGNLFRPDNSVIHGMKRLKVLMARKTEIEVVSDGTFRLSEYQEIREKFSSHLHSITRKKWIPEKHEDNIVTIHVRLGDFSRNIEMLRRGASNTSIPVSWYIDIVKQINKATDNSLHFLVFTDGRADEIKELLEINNVSLSKHNSSIGDMLALSDAKLVISSRSTFSLWARYIGNCSCITYTNSLIENVSHGEGRFEYETDSKIDDGVMNQIVALYCDSRARNIKRGKTIANED